MELKIYKIYMSFTHLWISAVFRVKIAYLHLKRASEKKHFLELGSKLRSKQTTTTTK
jgi:hypothetical protein